MCKYFANHGLDDYLFLKLSYNYMNRKNKEKDNTANTDADNNLKPGEPIPPKFSANWAQNIQFDKIVINLAGIYN